MRKFIEEELLAQIIAFEGNPKEQVKKCTQLFTFLSNADAISIDYTRKGQLGESITPILENVGLNEPVKNFLRGIQHYCLYTKSAELDLSAKAALEAFQSIKNGENVSEGYIALSLYMEGYCHEFGLGTDINFEAAFTHYQQAAEKQLAAAEGAMARFLEYGYGTPKNAKRSVEFYKKAVAHEDADGTWRYAWYCYGRKNAKLDQLAADAADLEEADVEKYKQDAATFEKDAHKYWKQAGMLGHLTALQNCAEVSTGLAKIQYDFLISIQPYAGFRETAQQVVAIAETYLSPNVVAIKVEVPKNTVAISLANVPTIWKDKNGWDHNPDLNVTVDNGNNSSSSDTATAKI